MSKKHVKRELELGNLPALTKQQKRKLRRLIRAR